MEGSTRDDAWVVLSRKQQQMAAGRRQKERKGLHNKILVFLQFRSCHKKWLFIIQKLMSWYLKSEPKGESRDFVWIGYISRLQRGVWAGENAVEGDNSWQYEGRFWLIPTSSSIYNPYLGTFPAPHRAARCLGDPPPPPPHHIDDAHHHITEIQISLQNAYTRPNAFTSVIQTYTKITERTHHKTGQ